MEVRRLLSRWSSARLLKESREGIGPVMEFVERERIRKDLESEEEERIGVREDESNWDVTTR